METELRMSSAQQFREYGCDATGAPEALEQIVAMMSKLSEDARQDIFNGLRAVFCEGCGWIQTDDLCQCQNDE